MRKFIASLVAKSLTKSLRAFQLGGRTALPGFLAEKIFPSLLSELRENFSKGIILITGTNGKTTTARLVTNVLKAKGYRVIHNFTGSNLTRGILGQILINYSLQWASHGHLGYYKCLNCGFQRTNLDISALSICTALDIELKSTIDVLSEATPDFGRLERFKVDSKECILLLAENPAGFSINIDTVKREKRKKNFLIILNDNLADGTDTSWIWNVDFESLKDEDFRFVICSGIRAEDIALRLKYACIPQAKIEIINDVRQAFQRAVALMNDDERLYILPNYTAMLAIRGYLAGEGLLMDFWRSQ
ncbi:DUF1727 domain-containing protein [bacterium]|nr:DUF1727 domain-containing protein [bacterium]